MTPLARAPRRLTAVALALLAVAALVGPSPAGAGSTADDRRSELQDELLEVSREEATLAGRLAEMEAERRRLDAEVAELDRQVAAAAAQLAAADAAVGEAMALTQAAEGRLARSQARLAEAVGLLQDQAVSAFMTGGNSTAAELAPLLQAGDMRELGAARTYTDAVIEHQQTIVDDVTRLRDRRAADLAAARQARQDADAARRAAQEVRDGVTARRAQVADLRAEAEGAAARQALLLAQARIRKAQFEKELAALAAVSSGIGEALRARQAGQVVVATGRGLLAVPLAGSRVSSPFGPRTHPIYGDSRLHAGMDFAAPSGTPIRAAAGGVVVTAGAQGGYGLTVVLDHGNGLATLYAHQHQLLVEPGQEIAAGDVVGLVGSTGASTGPHLHFEVRVLGAPVDPLAYL